MGCDIHFYVEKNVNGKWETADEWKTDVGDDDAHVSYKNAFYSGRCYNLFSILADVRNGRGFAGVRTGNGFNPIFEPRGLPDDVCQLVQDTSERWGDDAHSHSYLTVSEIDAFDWNQITQIETNEGDKDYPYHECVDQYFLSTTMPKLRALGKPDEVRAVFFFDN